MTSSPPYNIAHFEGPWTDAEIEAASSALCTFENQTGLPAPPYLWMAPWTMIKTGDGEASTLYIARRFRESTTLRAPSLPALIAAIEADAK